MQQLQFMKDYKNNEALRNSFFRLAADTFGLELERWYLEGFWNDRYSPHSYAAGEQIVANVSVNHLEFIIDGKRRTAVQLGTVMTHPDYRNQGLSKALLNQVLEIYGDSCDYIYLFANSSVLDFYPKFGFTPVEEQLFSAVYQPLSGAPGEIRKLSVNRPEDLTFLCSLAAQRQPVSEQFGTAGAHDLLMFYCLNVFSEDLYYLKDEEAAVICRQENHELHLFDIISHHKPDIRRILSSLAGSGTDRIVFHFTPDYAGLEVDSVPYDSGLFVKAGSSAEALPGIIKHPETSIA